MKVQKHDFLKKKEHAYLSVSAVMFYNKNILYCAVCTLIDGIMLSININVSFNIYLC